MIPLTPEQEGFVTRRQSITPAYLVEIHLDAVRHYSTVGWHSINGVEYSPGVIDDLRVQADSATLRIRNIDHVHTMPALRGEYQRRAVSIWWRGMSDDEFYFQPGYVDPGYVDEPDYTSAPMLIFRGHISAITEIGDSLSITVKRSKPNFYPAVRILPPLSAHTLPEGAVVQIGNVQYRVERRQS